MIDVVFPNNNEEEFLKMAEELGIKLLLIYDKIPFGTIEKLKEHYEFYTNKDIIIMKSTEHDRAAIASRKVDVLYGMENIAYNDGLHKRSSNLDKATCNEAKAAHVGFAFSLNVLTELDTSKHYGRMIRNVGLCRKSECKIILATFAKSPYELRSPKDMASFGILLGMHPTEAKQALDNLEELIDYKKKKREGKIITDGAEFLD